MYPFGRHDRGISRRTRDLLVLAVVVLFLPNLVQLIVHGAGSSLDATVRETFIAQARSDIESAQGLSTQLSRTGGTTTTQQLAQLRQYLYGLTQLNEMTAAIFGTGRALVPQSEVDATLDTVSSCESSLQAGHAIDSQLSTLRAQLATLAEYAAALGE